jgi:mannose-1-phosphate guanylyltransferase/mannose-6-phosphate isomerase
MLDAVSQILRCEKPWGRFEQYAHNVECTVKVITVAPGGTLSRQYHHHRDELWVVLDEGARVEVDGEFTEPGAGARVFVPRRAVHRLSAPADREVRVLEVSFGEFDEEDIVRVDDVYGRAPLTFARVDS